MLEAGRHPDDARLNELIGEAVVAESIPRQVMHLQQILKGFPLLRDG